MEEVSWGLDTGYKLQVTGYKLQAQNLKPET